MELMEIREELFRQEFPQLLADSDPDIERYYYLRNIGQGRTALNIYQFRLKPRYPDDALRMVLLRSYRNRDPLYPKILAVGYRRLADQALGRVCQTIDYVKARIASCDTKDVYSTIKTIEDILRIFPREQYEAVSGIDRMCRYSQVLNRHVKAMEQAAEMVRSYLSQSLPVVEKERKRRREEQFRRVKDHSAAAVDFSLAVFSPEDLGRIEISPAFSRVEDQTLAYCMKYWNLVDDDAFEQILSLYSRKYQKKNHAVYAIIRQGRRANRRDEEILTSVMSLLVKGYYYSIQGDQYLQQNWRKIKLALERAVPAAKTPARARPGKTPPETAAAANNAPAPMTPVPAKAGPPAASSARTAPPKPAAGERGRAAKAAAPSTAAAGDDSPARTAPPKPAAGERERAVKAAAPSTAAAGDDSPAWTAPPKPAAGERGRAAKVVVPSMATAGGRPRIPPAALPEGGSVSDRLRKLSGRSYDLYQDRFLAHARPAIRKILGSGRGLFFTLPEKVEDLVYAYLRDHYADPYMNWAESEERRQLVEQGFHLPSLNPVIDECFKRIK
ncbi:MAG: hypothetical protein LBH51_07790 [Treponema sp.]|jgi:hypothetical protein|nr:hypothetical protein [Treponema sp.]